MQDVQTHIVAVGIPSSGDSGRQGTGSPLHDIVVEIPSSGDSVQWGFRSVGIPGTYRCNLLKIKISYEKFSIEQFQGLDLLVFLI